MYKVMALKMKGYSLQSILLLIAATNMLTSAQLVSTSCVTVTEYYGSGDSDSISPSTFSSIDRTATKTVSTSQPLPTSQPSSVSTMNIAPTVLQSSNSVLPSIATSLSPSTTVVSSSLILTTTSTQSSTTTSTTSVTRTTSVTGPPTQFSTAITTQASSINLTNMDDNPGLPLPVLIAVPAGGVVLISAIFIVVVLCCVRRRMRRKYTLKTAKNGSNSRGHGRRSATPVLQDLKDLTTTDNSKNLQGFGLAEETTAGTFGIEFPETPKYGSNEDIPALIILNPVKAIEPSSNALWSQTLPTRQKIRKQTYSESDKPDEPDPGVLKPAKSVSDIDTLTRGTDSQNKVNDGTSKTLLLPDLKKSDAIANEHEYDHLSPEDFPDLIGGTGYVFLEASAKQALQKSKAETSALADAEPKVDEDTIYLEPSSLPAPSQPPQHIVPTESTATAADTESVYDTPKSSGIDTSILSPQESKQSTSSGPELSSISSREISVEVPSHYDVPKSALSSFKVEAPKQLRFSAQPNLGSREVSQTAGSPLDNDYDCLGSHNAAQQPESPPYYDIPKHLLMAKNGTSTGKKSDSADNAQGQKTNKDNAEPLESSDEHVYCVPPDVAVNVLKPPPHKPLKSEDSQTDKMEAANSSKPVPMRRKKNDNTARNSVVPAPRPTKRAINLPKKNGPKSVSSSLEDLLQDSAEAKTETKLVPVPKPAVLKKPKVIPKSDTSSLSSSSEDILQEQGRRKVPVSKPVVAKKSKVQLPKNGTGSVTSSCEELLKDQEQKDGAVNGEKPNSNSPCADGSAANSKPKPRVMPRSQSRHGIVPEQKTKQTLQQTTSNADVPGKPNTNKIMSTKSVAPKRPAVQHASSSADVPGKANFNKVVNPKRAVVQINSNADLPGKARSNKAVMSPKRQALQASSSANVTGNQASMSPKRQAVHASSSADVPGKANSNQVSMSPKRQALQASSSADVPGKTSSKGVVSSAQSVALKRPPIPQRPIQRPPPDQIAS